MTSAGFADVPVFEAVNPDGSTSELDLAGLANFKGKQATPFGKNRRRAAKAAAAKMRAASGDKNLAVLSTKARKKLPASKFAGPGRSYPVPDKAHAANAKARATQALNAGRISKAQHDKIHRAADRVLNRGKGNRQADLAITPGGRAGDASPLGTHGPRRLTDYERELAHALMRKGHPKKRAIAMARGIIRNAAVAGKWGPHMVKNPAVRAGAIKSRAEMHALSNTPTREQWTQIIDFANTLDLGENGAKWRHGYIPLNAEALAIKEHRHGGSSPRKGRTLGQALAEERHGPSKTYTKTVLGSKTKSAPKPKGRAKSVENKVAVPKGKKIPPSKDVPSAEHLANMKDDELKRFLDETHSMKAGKLKDARLAVLHQERARRVKAIKDMQAQAEAALKLLDKYPSEADPPQVHSKFLAKLYARFPALRKHHSKIVRPDGRVRGRKAVEGLIEKTKEEVFRALAGPFILVGLSSIGLLPGIHVGG